MRPTPIRIGDKFKTALAYGRLYAPCRAGKIELFESEQCCFVDSNYHNVRSWKRVA
jgi:hypothetical protein